MAKSDDYLRDILDEQTEALNEVVEKLFDAVHLTTLIKADYKYMVDMVIEQLDHKDKLAKTNVYVNDDPAEIVSGE